MSPIQILSVAVLSLCVAFAASAQPVCPAQWLPGDGVPGVSGSVYAQTLWDPDGAGPLPAQLVVAGSFTLAGNVLANNIATYNPATGAWSALGTGMDGGVRALTTLPNGDLVAGGGFTTAGNQVSVYLARYTFGTSCPADFNCSGDISVQDIFDFLAAYFTGC